jgi:hypothetical protein
MLNKLFGSSKGRAKGAQSIPDPSRQAAAVNSYRAPVVCEVGTLRHVQSGHGRYYDGFGYNRRG